jgi:hypothetical protein
MEATSFHDKKVQARDACARDYALNANKKPKVYI